MVARCFWQPSIQRKGTLGPFNKLIRIPTAALNNRICGFSKYYLHGQEKERELYCDPKALYLPFSTDLKVYIRGGSNLGLLDSNELSGIIPSFASNSKDLPQSIVGEVLLEGGQKRPLWSIQIPPQYSPSLEKNGSFAHWRPMLPLLPEEEIKLLVIGRSLLLHQQTYAFCPRCGSKLGNGEAGSTRVCPSAGCSKYFSWYPNVHPVMISLVSCGDECLLIRTPTYTPRIYTCVAGFLETGETMEDCVKREIKEEVGLEVCSPVKYEFSQAWPTESSSNLMLACTVQTDNKNFNLDPNEIEDGKWFSKAEVRRMLNNEPTPFLVPGKGTSAHRLLTQWVK
eukprot:TRINITY_DN6329_c0_g1_i1.p1 TRINITY_DN6329_c0_g1~~TRINITY_DN6329_c0_g1_i1.p1  ORF type:complete len:340 (-),score=50.47 TRINITY_DN6329_c0_g1_i1:23-1042(-)